MSRIKMYAWLFMFVRKHNPAFCPHLYNITESSKILRWKRTR